jgi:amidase
VDHVLTRSVRDSAAALDAIAGPDVGAPYYMPAPERPYQDDARTQPGRLRIAFTTQPMLGREVHPDCVAAVTKTVELLRSLGHLVEEAAPAFDGKAFARNFMLMVAGECRGDIEEAARLSGRTATAAKFEPTTWALGLLGRSLSAADFVTATRALQMDARRIGQFFTAWDVLLTPTVSTPPPLVGSLQPSARDRTVLTMLGRMNAGRLLDMMGMLDEAASEAFEFTPWTPVFNVTGQPAMSVPLEWNAEGLPIGLHFVGRFGDEATLFRLAGQLEQAKPWIERRPTVS